MPREGFEPTIPVFKRAKTVHASDQAATVISIIKYTETNIIISKVLHLSEISERPTEQKF
jgi:hypothetical protein